MTLASVEGGDGQLPEPDWSTLFSDELDIAAAHEQWGVVVRELRDAEKLATANAHQIRRLVISYVMHDLAARRVAEQGAVIKAKRTSVPQYNPWWTVLKDANAMASSHEAELTLSPRRRSNGGKVQRKQKRISAADSYLKPVAR